MALDLPSIIQRIVIKTDVDAGAAKARETINAIGREVDKANRATEKYAKTTERLRSPLDEAVSASNDLDEATKRVTRSALQAADGHTRAGAAVRRLNKDTRDAKGGQKELESGFDKLLGKIQKFGGGVNAIGSVVSLLKFPTIISAIPQLASGLVGLASGAFAAAASLSQLVGVAAALPGLFAAAAQGAASVFAGTRGIGEALKAGSQSQKTGSGGGETKRQAQRRVEDASTGLTDAQRNLVDAERAVADADLAVVKAHEQLAEATTNVRKTQEALAEADRELADTQAGLATARAEAVREADDLARAVATAGAAEQSARQRVADAEARLTAAQERARNIQEAVNEARKAAADELERLRFAAEGAAISEERAALRLTDAQKAAADAAAFVADAQNALARARSSGNARRVASAEADLADALARQKAAVLDLRDAQLSAEEASSSREDTANALAGATDAAAKAEADFEKNVATRVIEEQNAATLDLVDANRDLSEVLNRNAENQDRLAKIQREGLSGTQTLTDYEDRLARAVETRAEAQKAAAVAAGEGLAEAQRGVERAVDAADDARYAYEKAARSVQRAFEDMQDAQNGLASGGAAGQKFKDAMDALSPAAQALVKRMLELKPTLDEIKRSSQEALAPSLMVGLNNLTALAPIVSKSMADTAKAIGGVIERLTAQITTPQWLSDIAFLGGQNTILVEKFGHALGNLVTAGRDLMVAAAPLTQAIADLIDKGIGRLAGAIAAGRQSGDLAAFFERALDKAKLIGSIISNIAGGLYGLGKAAMGLGDGLFGSLDTITQRLRDFTNSTEGQAKLKGFFDGLRGPLSEVGKLAGDIVRAFGRVAAKGDFGNLASKLRTEVLPVLEKIASAGSGKFLDQIIGLGAVLGNLFANLGGTSGTLGTFVESLTGLAKAVNFLVEKVPGFGEFVILMLTFSKASKAFAGSGVISGVTKFNSVLGGTGVGFQVLTKAFPAATTGATTFGGALKALSATLLANPVVAFIAGIVALGAALFVLYKKNKAFHDFIDRTWQAIQRVFDRAVAAITPTLETLGKFFTGVLIPAGKKVIDFFVSAWPAIAEVLKAVFATAAAPIRIWWDYVQAVFAAVVRVVRGAIDLVVGIFTGDWSRAWDGAKNIVGGAFDYIKAAVGLALDFLVELFVKLPGRFIDALGAVGSWLWDKVLGPSFGAIGGLVLGVLDEVVVFFAKLPGRFVGALGAVGSWLWDSVLKPGFNWAKDRISETIGFYVDFYVKLPGRLVGALGAAGSWLWDKVLAPGFNWAKDRIEETIGFYVDFFTKLPGRFIDALGTVGSWLWDKVLKPGFTNALDMIRSTVDDIVDFFFKLPDRLAWVLGGLADMMRGIFVSVFNGIAAVWNNTVGKLSFGVPDWVPGIGGNGFDVPDIPTIKAAKGAVVDQPTLALIGEAASAVPEIVTPERLMQSVFQSTLSAELGKLVEQLAQNTSTQNGPAVQIDHAEFRDAVDVDLVFARAQHAMSARRF